jgi:hypothetical protein
MPPAQASVIYHAHPSGEGGSIGEDHRAWACIACVRNRRSDDWLVGRCPQVGRPQPAPRCDDGRRARRGGRTLASRTSRLARAKTTRFGHRSVTAALGRLAAPRGRYPSSRVHVGGTARFLGRRGAVPPHSLRRASLQPVRHGLVPLPGCENRRWGHFNAGRAFPAGRLNMPLPPGELQNGRARPFRRALPGAGR